VSCSPHVETLGLIQLHQILRKFLRVSFLTEVFLEHSLTHWHVSSGVCVCVCVSAAAQWFSTCERLELWSAVASAGYFRLFVPWIASRLFKDQRVSSCRQTGFLTAFSSVCLLVFFHRFTLRVYPQTGTLLFASDGLLVLDGFGWRIVFLTHVCRTDSVCVCLWVCVGLFSCCMRLERDRQNKCDRFLLQTRRKTRCLI